MKEAQRLKAKIGRLAATTGGHGAEGRPIVSPGQSDGLTAVLREIDETVLPRALTLSSARGSIVVTAGNRRLISIDTVSGDALVDVAGVAGLSLTRPDVADLGRLRDALVAAFDDADVVRVKSAPIPGGTMTFADGTTAVALASAWGIELIDEDKAAPQEPLDAFLASMTHPPRAWLQTGGGKIKSESGTADVVAKLKTFAGSADMARLSTPGEPASGRFIAIGRAPGDGDCLLFVSHKADSALVLLPSDQIEAAKANWQASLG